MHKMQKIIRNKPTNPISYKTISTSDGTADHEIARKAEVRKVQKTSETHFLK